MAVWTVFEHDKFASDTKMAERAIFVRDGFSWLAFLFGPLWLLAHRMVVVLILYVIVVGGASVAAGAFLNESAATGITLALMAWFGFEAAGLRRWALSRRGWRLVGVAEARRRIEAERRYFTDRLADDDLGEPQASAPSHPPMPWGPAPDQPVLGLFPDGAR